MTICLNKFSPGERLRDSAEDVKNYARTGSHLRRFMTKHWLQLLIIYAVSELWNLALTYMSSRGSPGIVQKVDKLISTREYQ